MAERLKNVLSDSISSEQFGFLKDGKIHDAVGVAQQCLHSLKMKHKKAFVLKIDLIKAYDEINWDFLRLILLQIGIQLVVVHWIIACITSASFVVLVNGSPSEFFNSSCGVRQGCSLSLLLFILIIEGLSRLIRNYREEGKSKVLQ